MNLATFANDRLAIVSREPRTYAIHVDESLLTRFGQGWYLDDQKVTRQQAVNLAASGKIVLRKAPAIRKVFSQALATAKKKGADFSEGPCTSGHSRDQHSYTPRCGGSIACTVCPCNNYDEHSEVA
jgi:hypothetical protein